MGVGGQEMVACQEDTTEVRSQKPLLRPIKSEGFVRGKSPTVCCAMNNYSKITDEY